MSDPAFGLTMLCLLALAFACVAVSLGRFAWQRLHRWWYADKYEAGWTGKE